MASLRRALALPAVACLILFAAVGCQAILGIDDTSFQSGDSDSGAVDGSADASNDANASTDGSTDAQSSTAAVTFSPTHVFVNQGREVDVTVNLARNGFTGAATLALASVGDAGITSDGGSDGGGADGIGATSLTIPSGSNTGIIHLFASATATIGPTTLDFTLTAGKAGVASLPALVGGPPGSVDTTFGINGVAALVGGYQPVSVAVGDDDSIWLVNNAWKVLHYFSNGTSDDTLNTKFASTLSTAGGSSSRIAVRGAVVLLCGSDSGQPTLRKLTTAGDYDPTFQSAGIFVPKDSSDMADGNFTGVAFSPAGDILLSGVVTGPIANLGGVVYRITSAKTDTFVIGQPFVPAGVGADSSGNVGAGGLHTTPDGGTNFFAQAIDPSFHDAGLSSVGNPINGYTIQKAIVTTASQIAVAGTNQHGLPGGALAAFSTTTGANIFFHDPGHNASTWDEGFNTVASQADGKMLVSDETGGGPLEHAYVERIDTAGNTDPTYGFSKGFAGSSPFLTFVDLAVDSVGRVVVAGTSDSNLYLTRVWP